MDLQLVLLLCLGAMVLNLPFGYYRAGTRKFSWRWFLAVHLPVPLIVAMRLISGVSWEAIPLIVTSDVAGQIIGGMIRAGLRQQPTTEEVSVEEDE
ncbi:MAG: hypothetical protein ACYCW5_06620 [Thermoleophilia bacterium]